MGEKFKVVLTDSWFDDITPYKRMIDTIDCDFEFHQCTDEDKLIEICRDADVVTTHHAPITRRIIESLEKCKLINIFAVGTDPIDIQAATDCGIWVANTPDYGVYDVADHALMLILSSVKKLWMLCKDTKEGHWNYNPSKPIHRLKDATLGLIGFGRIPQMVAERAKAFGMNIITADPFIDKSVVEKAGAKLVDYETLYRESDVISVHAPLNDSTRHLVDAAAFDKMKQGAFIVNTARGAVIDEKAMIAALNQGKIAGAGLDLVEDEHGYSADHPFTKMDNVTITPHSAWYSEEAHESLLELTGLEVVRAFNGELPRCPVNKL